MLQTHSTTEEDVEVYINSIVKTRSATSRKLKEISNATSMDSDLQEVIYLTFNGWPRKKDRLNRGVNPYFTYTNDLSVYKKWYFQDRIVIQQNLRAEMLRSIYKRYLELIKCRDWAKMSIWWPKISQEIDDFIKRYKFCNSHYAANPNESLKPTRLPDRPWQKVGTEWAVQLSRERLFLPILGNSEIKSTNK